MSARTQADTGTHRKGGDNHMTAPRTIRRLVAITDATAELGGVSRSTIYDLVNRGHLTKVNIGRRGFITAESLDGYVESLMAQCD